MKIVLTKSKIFIFLNLVFIVGIFFASLLPVEVIKNDLWWFGLAIGCLIITLLSLNNLVETQDFASLLFCLLAILFFAFWRYSLSIPIDGDNKIWHYNDQKVTLEGVIKAEPDIRENQVKYVVTAKYLDNSKKEIDGNLLVTTNLYPGFEYGDVVKIHCQLKKPKNFEEFAYDRYLARFDIYSVCYFPQMLKLESDDTSFSYIFYNKIYQIKNQLRAVINNGLVEPEASLTRGMILGDQKGLPTDLRENFAKTGLSHIVAISGMNITLLIVWLFWLLLFFGLWRKQAFYFSVIIIFFYIVLIGAPVSAVRAGVMSALVLWAAYLGRLSKLENSLVFSAAIMILINPKILRDDIGFQLSFLALLGIIYCYPVTTRWLEKMKMPNFLFVRELVSLTVAAQITTIPIIAMNFSQIALISPLSNLLILWTLAPIMILAFLAMGISLLLPSISLFIFAPVQAILSYVIWVVNIMARPGLASWETGRLSWLIMIVYYLALIYLVITTRKAAECQKKGL
ncbi:MAG: internalization-related competence protein ComEC/Rec2 protein [Parcubacteria group bacterium GW2011_GWE2_39_37]|uniref:Internalization-related competence protein ComEC/Rec2 protein n=1 Tax=Candidatus Falkowbacteria bacterium GW2011_GWF2_39_8 TaxID=1618642 RepID=A0A0G0PTD3_9BACT|nr:MAG: internalization-related competence protein ComEC/Rec2 protein [Parcubacteria group bacterium GW2011_GWE2_39_37]KKR31153.1 MAG: internalization-related competence protein ComEC/Rec2 protein [Candidatus Falkowbacteria bacterium GW2011_GWF2_39_8]